MAEVALAIAVLSGDLGVGGQVGGRRLAPTMGDGPLSPHAGT